MGVKLLNTFLKCNCKKCLESIHLSNFKGKKICIDISIYIYKFLSENSLLEKIYLLSSILKKYYIIPLFIFDGKNNNRKAGELKLRRENRIKSYKEYDKIMQDIKDNNIIMDSRLKKKLLNLKRNMVKLNSNHIENVKKLLDSMGLKYIQAIGEADSLCAELVLKKKVFACLSDDTDLFVYGCTNVINNINLLNHTITYCNINTLLKHINITLFDFKCICILSGTDYCLSKNNIFKNYQYYLKYINSEEKYNQSFIEWMIYNNIITTNLNELNDVLNIYNLEKNKSLNKYKYMLINYLPVNYSKTKELLKTERFLFI